MESRVSAQVGVTVWDWRHQRFPQEIFWEKLTKLTFTNITSTGKIVGEANSLWVSSDRPAAVPAGKPITKTNGNVWKM